MHHSDDTNNTIRTQLKVINRYVNYNFQLIVPCLNFDKTEIIIFGPKGKDRTQNFNFRINNQEIYGL